MTIPRKMCFADKMLMVVFACALFGAYVVSCVPLTAYGASGDDSKTHAQSRAVGYMIDKQTAAYRVGVAVADTDDSDAWGSIPEFDLLGRPNIPVSLRFSGAAADTCTIKVAYYYKEPDGTLNYKGSSLPIVVTALAGIDANGDNEGAMVGFDGRGSNVIKVIAIAISAGNVDMWVGSH